MPTAPNQRVLTSPVYRLAAFESVSKVIRSTVQELLNARLIEDSRALHLFMEMVIFVCFSNLLYWR